MVGHPAWNDMHQSQHRARPPEALGKPGASQPENRGGQSCPGRAEDLGHPGWKPDHTPLPAICPLPMPREIEFLKKETAQRRVLEESELARKEEMDKLLDKVGSGRPVGRAQWREQH